jgi:hypothetical protein
MAGSEVPGLSDHLLSLARFTVGLSDFYQLFPQDLDPCRCLDTHSDITTSHADDRDDDVIVNDNPLVDLPIQNQHSIPSLD